MKILSWEVKIGIALILISIIIYKIKFAILGDPKDSYIFILNALGFIPYEWIYTLVICANYRALLDDTPFGIRLTMEDAAKRFPEILEWWNRRYDLTEEEMIKYGFV